ncbi:GNAT family N-acetyltransferase [Oligella sp. HMSC05A10]|uniref:GNAT family N-acetyltransferase n=1 Tax=Oligella sp. HMSC05A10 TaxID=1581112 RepID=UPI0009F4278D|nr:GNAT family N-acetyltransferase [Oligella sp. HMSC05A10]
MKTGKCIQSGLIMPTADLPSQFVVKLPDFDVGFHEVRFPFDVPLLHKWLNTKHTIEQWQLNKSLAELLVHFEKAVHDEHQELYLISCDGVPFAYCEIYTASYDRLAKYYKVDPLDVGWHVLIGEREFLGKSFAENLVFAISHFVFSQTESRRIIVEPDVRVKWYVIFKRFAYISDSIIELPEKSANIFLCLQKQFYESSGYLSKAEVKVAYETHSD